MSDTFPNESTLNPGREAEEKLARERSHADTELIPQRLGKYAIHSLLGGGAFGRVLRGFDPDLQREVAIKIPRAGLTQDLREEFLREARAAAQIKHQFVCEIYEVGQEADIPFIVMPLVEGTLAKRMAQAPPLSAREALTIARNVALGLHAAHKKNIVHRDMKPANVLYDVDEDRVLITDFGLAKVVNTTMTLGANGAPLLKGTPLYMSPEQWNPNPRNPVGPASDIYSLGVILYELLAGVPPFTSPDGSVFSLGFLTCGSDPIPPSEVCPDLDPDLDEICLTALAKAPAKRYPSAKDFADAIAEYLSRPEKVRVPDPSGGKKGKRTRAERRAQAEADYQSGNDAYHGRGGPQDYAKAREFYKKAARQGHAGAQFNLGLIYRNGRGLERDYAKAREWFEEAAEREHPGAEYNLGLLYYNGHDVPQDYAKAREWFELAAARGHAAAQYNLGLLYRNGLGVPQDYEKARELYERAAGQGHAPAQCALGLLYENGRGGPQDDAKAREWYEKAAAQGDVAAQGYLAELYENGRGVEADRARAVELYRQAARQGSEYARTALRRLGESE